MRYRDYNGKSVVRGYYVQKETGEIFEIRNPEGEKFSVRSRYSPKIDLIDVPESFASKLIRLTEPKEDAKFILRNR